MIALKKDIFTHLVLSANKHKNDAIKSVRSEVHTIINKPEMNTSITTPDIHNIVPDTKKGIQLENIMIAEPATTNKNNEKLILSLKEDMRNIELLLHKIKKSGKNPEKILILENKLIRLKKLIEAL